MKTVIVTLLTALSLLAQQKGTPVQQVQYPYDAPSNYLDNAGTANIVYACYTSPNGPWANNTVAATFSWTIAATTLTNIVVSTNVGTVTTATAHGLQVGQLFTVSGATVDPDLNGTYYIQSVPSSTTFTITTASVSNATYTDATLAVSSSAPRLTAAIWSIYHFLYDSSNNFQSKQCAGGACANFTNICANRAVTTGATKITYK